LSSLTTGVLLCVGITAWNFSGQGPAVWGNFTTAPLPLAPTGLIATAETYTTVSLSWTNPGGGGLVNDTIYWAPGLHFPACLGAMTAHSLGSAGTSYTVTGLTPATAYGFAVTAWNLSGQSPQSNCLVPVYTQSNPLPGPPTGVTATTYNSTVIDIVWTQPTGGGILNNSFFAYVGASCLGSAFFTNHSVAPYTTRTMFGLTPGTVYSFKVNATNATGTGPASACATNTTAAPPTTPSLTISNIAVTTFEESWSNGTWVNVTYVELVIANDSVSCQGNEHGAATWTYNVSLVLTHWITQTGGVVAYEYNGTQGLNFSFLPGETVWVGLLYSTSDAFTNETACQQITFPTIPPPPPPVATFDIYPLILLAIVAGVITYAVTRRKKHGEW
jgi:hypothetical protein